MAWERSKSPIVVLSPPPRWGYWLTVGAVTLLTGTGLFLLSASDRFTSLSAINIWQLTLFFPLLWLVAICIRCRLWGREVEHNEFLNAQARQAQSQWQEWSERYLAVLSSWVLLPVEAAAVAVSHYPDPDVAVQYRRVCKLDETSGRHHCFSQLSDSIFFKINELPVELPILITLVTDSSLGDEEDLLTALTNCMAESASNRPEPPQVRVRYQFSLLNIAERLARPELTVELVIIMQLNPASHYSHGMAALLLTSDDVAIKYKLDAQAQILRPMPVSTSDFNDEIEQFLITQRPAVQATDVFVDSSNWHGEIGMLLTQGQKQSAAWQAEDIRIVERWSGVPGPYSPWIMAAIAVDRVQLQKASTLVLSRNEQESFVYTITAGSENEQNE